MHSKPMSELEGEFSKPEIKMYVCRKCKQKTATCRSWESSDGAYEDYKYECTNKDCNYYWWIEGIDS